MHLRTQTYTSNLPKTFVLFVVLVLFSLYSNTIFANTQSANCSASTLKKNRKKTKQFDTLFCDQKPIAKIMTLNAVNDSFATYYCYHITDTSLLMVVKPKAMPTKVTPNQSKVYYHFEFPNIQMLADYKPKVPATNVKDIICEYLLINKYGLDTLKSEMFATIHGNILDKNTKKVDAEKLFIVERNKMAEIKIEDIEISQDGIFLGRCEEEELDGPNGKIIQYSIFNSTGALVCVASKMPSSKGSKLIQWNLLTQRDMRFSSVQLKSDNFVIELLKFLVTKSII